MSRTRIIAWLVSSILASGVGLGVTLLGDVFDTEILESLAADAMSVQILTALCLAFCAGALILAHRGPGLRWSSAAYQALGALIWLAGLLSFLAHLGPIAWGQELSWANAPLLSNFFSLPARMEPLTAWIFMGFGSALCFLAVRNPRIAVLGHVIAWPAFMLSYLIFFSYCFNANELPTWMRQLAFSTAFACCVLGGGLFYLRPDTFLVGVLMRRTPGGLMARRLLPAVIFAPALMAGMRFLAGRTHAVGSPLAAAFVVLSSGFVLLVVLWFAARSGNLAIEKIRRESDLLRLILTSIGDAVLTTNAVGRITYFNPAAAELTGWQEEQALGQSLRSVLRITSASSRSSDQDVFRSMEDLPRNAALVTREGREVLIENRAAHIEDKSGRLVGFVFVFREAAAKWRTEDQPADRSLQDRLALEAAGLGVWEYSSDTGVLLWDSRCRELWGVSGEDRIDYSVASSRIHAEDREGIGRAFRDAAGGGGDGSYAREFRVVWPDGSIHWIASCGLVKFQGEGQDRKAVRFVGADRDITRRKQDDEKLHQQLLELEREIADQGGISDRLKAIIDTSADRIATADTDFRCTYFNEAWRGEYKKLFGVDIQIGKDIVDSTAQNPEAACAEKTRELWGRAMQGEAFCIEQALEDSGMQRRSYEFHFFPIHDREGKVAGAGQIVRDITTHRVTEEALKEMNDLLQRLLAERTAELRQTKDQLRIVSAPGKAAPSPDRSERGSQRVLPSAILSAGRSRAGKI